MSERWPAALGFADACAYLGVKATKGKAILDRIPSFQHFTGEKSERGDRYWRRVTLDAYIEEDIDVAPSPEPTLPHALKWQPSDPTERLLGPR